MNFKPLSDRLLVKREEQLTESVGGILIPDSAKERPLRGTVLATGTGKRAEDGSQRDLDVKVGDTVVFGKYSGTEIQIAGEEHTILREEDVLGVVEA